MLTFKVVKMPRLLAQSTNLRPYFADAEKKIADTIKQRQGRGLGARRNIVEARPAFQSQQIFSTMNHPRRTGVAMQRNQERRFKSMAPSVVRKYIIQPIEALWRASV